MFVTACSKRSRDTADSTDSPTPPTTPAAQGTPTDPPNPGESKGTDAGTPEKWKTVRAEVGKFVVDLPPNSIDDKSGVSGIGDLMVQVGGKIKNHNIGVFSTKCMDQSAKAPAAEAVENSPQMPQFKNQKSITLQDHPGVERRSDDGRTVARCYATNDRVYIISITTQLYFPQLHKSPVASCIPAALPRMMWGPNARSDWDRFRSRQTSSGRFRTTATGRQWYLRAKAISGARDSGWTLVASITVSRPRASRWAAT